MLNLQLDYHSGVPIYRQMVDAISTAIRQGELQAGDRLPPIRKLSQELDINPNTTARVYRELELGGFIESRTGAGCFVKEGRLEQLTGREREQKIESLLARVIREAKAFHIDEQELLHSLKGMTARRIGEK